MKQLITLLVIFLVSSRLVAAPILLVQSQDPQKNSRVVVIDGQEMIMLPDSRIIPMGQYTICGDGCAVPAIADGVEIKDGFNRRHLLWAIPLLAGIAIWGRIGGRDCSQIVPPPSPGIPTTPVVPDVPVTPATPVPEPAFLAFGGVLLLGFAEVLRKKKLDVIK